MSETPHRQPDVSRETSGQEGRNKRSSVYIYLTVLFGAAFLMLLLAYFVQQRNNANVQNDLRTTTASRAELLEDIQQLTKENEQLRQDAAKLQESLEQSEAEAQTLARRIQETSDQLTSWSSFWSMENAFRAGDYDSCVEFFRNAAGSSWYATPESAQARYEEIYHDLEAQGYFGEDAPAKR